MHINTKANLIINCTVVKKSLTAVLITPATFFNFENNNSTQKKTANIHIKQLNTHAIC